jgi:hypothetical protein
MPSLSDRLKSLGVVVGTQHLPTHKAPASEQYSIEQVLAGDFWQTSAGEVFVVETNYNADFLRGAVKLKATAPMYKPLKSLSSTSNNSPSSTRKRLAWVWARAFIPSWLGLDALMARISV